jgi:hypothetical protein
VNGESRTVVSTGYLGQMFKAKIIVTSNPSDWEGGKGSSSINVLKISIFFTSDRQLPFTIDSLDITSRDKATHSIKQPTHSKSRKQCKYSILYLYCLRDFEGVGRFIAAG